MSGDRKIVIIGGPNGAGKTTFAYWIPASAGMTAAKICRNGKPC